MTEEKTIGSEAPETTRPETPSLDVPTTEAPATEAPATEPAEAVRSVAEKLGGEGKEGVDLKGRNN